MTEWTAVEDAVLRSEAARGGKLWAMRATDRLEGRTPAMCAGRFRALIRAEAQRRERPPAAIPATVPDAPIQRRILRGAGGPSAADWQERRRREWEQIHGSPYPAQGGEPCYHTPRYYGMRSLG